MQDMAKAYNSIGLIPLYHAFKRIKIPNNIIEFINNLFFNRQIRIITSYGLSQPFTGNDGIDQGKTISPLFWRIFYDLLLSRIQNNPNLGIQIDTKWLSGILKKLSLTLSCKIVVSAFM